MRSDLAPDFDVAVAPRSRFFPSVLEASGVAEQEEQFHWHAENRKRKQECGGSQGGRNSEFRRFRQTNYT
jgi:hypothetical protein